MVTGCNMIQIHHEQRDGRGKNHTINPDIFHLILMYCHEVNSIQHESNYIYYVQTKCCKPFGHANHICFYSQ